MSNPVTIVPAQPVAKLFSGFDPLDLPALIAYVQALQAKSDGQVNLTLDGIRALQNPSPLLRYYCISPGQEGLWKVKVGDTTTVDNTGLDVVCASGERIEREFDEFVRLSWWGVKQGDDISLLIKNISFLLAEKGMSDRYVRVDPGSSYSWKNYVVLNPHPIKVRCVEGISRWSTSLDQMLWITRNSEFTGIRFVGSSGAAYPQEQWIEKSLVTNSAVSEFRRCGFFGSRGNGISNDGNVMLRNDIFPSGSNSSRALFDDCEFRENKGSGWYTAGVDANIILVRRYNATDNGGYGLCDDSFLGCMMVDAGHTNNNKLGSHRIYDPNNRSLLLGAYEEDGQPASSIGGRATMVGNRMTGSPSIGPYVLRLDAQSTYIAPNG